MAETITIRKEEFENIRKRLLDSMQLIEEIEFREGVKKGREQFAKGNSISLEDYKKKHRK
jgi:hypothetical protein